MRIIAVKTIRDFYSKYPKSEQSLKSWLQEAERSNWDSPQMLKLHYRNASILNSKRVVFNINGNKFRLLVDIEYRLKIVFVIWFGTHVEYDQIDSKKIAYVKTNKR